MKSENLNFLELFGPLQACNGTVLPFITYSEFVSLASGVQHTTQGVPNCHLWPVRSYNISLDYLINGKVFLGGGY